MMDSRCALVAVFALLSLGSLAGCASKTSTIEPEKSAAEQDNSTDPVVVFENASFRLVGTRENEEGRRIRQALARSETVTIGENAVTIDMNLQLPQIEIPRGLKQEEQLHIKREPDKGVHVFNGHICLIGKASSKSGINYSKAGWKFKVEVDDKKVAAESDATPAEILDFQANKSIPIPGETNLRVCTKAKFPKVKKVQLTMSEGKDAKGAKGENVLMFLWSAPWPNEESAPVKETPAKPNP